MVTLKIAVYGLESPLIPASYSRVTAEIIDLQSGEISDVFNGEVEFNGAGNIEIVTWKQLNLDFDQIVKGLVRFMKLSFKSDADLPEAYSIEINFENIDIKKYSYSTEPDQNLIENNETYKIESNQNSLICVASSSILVTCQNNKIIPKGSLIEVVTLAKFLDEQIKVESIYFKTSNNLILCKSIKSISIGLSKTALLLTGVSLFISNNAEYPKQQVSNLNSIQDGFLYIEFEFPESLPRSSNLTIFSIFSDDSNKQPSKISLKSPIASKFSFNHSFSDTFTYNNTEISEGNLIYTFPEISVETGKSIQIMITYLVNESPKINLPLIPSNFQLRYETLMRYSTPSATYIFSKPFTVASDTLKSSGIYYFCSTLQYPNLITASFSSVVNYQPPSNIETFLEIWFHDDNQTFTDDFGSGVKPGNEYPAMDLLENEYLLLANAENSGFSAGLILKLDQGFSINDRSFRFPLFKAAELQIFNVTFKFKVKENNFYFDVFQSQFQLNEFGRPLKTLKNFDFFDFIAGEIADPLQIVIEDGVWYDTRLFVVFPEGFKLSGKEEITIEPPPEESNVIFMNSHSSKIHSVFIFAMYLWVDTAYLVIKNLTPGNFTGKFYITMMNFGNSFNIDCYRFSDFPVFVYQKDNFKILKIEPDSFFSAGPGFFELGLVADFMISKNFYLETSYQIDIGFQQMFSKIKKCEVQSSFSTFESRIVENHCFITTNETINLKSFSVKFIIVPPIAYENTFVGLFSVLEITQGSYVIVSGNTSQSSNSVKIFLSNNSPALSKVTNLKVFPDYLTKSYSELYVSLVLTYDIPANSLIRVKGINFQNDSDTFKNTWITGGFSDSYVNSGSLYLKTYSALLKDSKLHIYKRNAFLFKSKGVTDCLLISITFSGVDIIKDIASSVSSYQRLIIKEKLSQDFISVSMSRSVNSVNELSLYEFYLSIDLIIQKSHIFIFDFSKNYSLNPGNFIEKYSDEKEVFYLEIDETKIQCFSLYWKLVCKSMIIRSGNEEIKFSLPLLNPKESSDNEISVYLLDKNETILSYKKIKDSIKNYSNMTLLDLKVENIKDNGLNVFDLLFSIKPGKNINENDILIISFPDEFQIDLYNPIINCSIGLNQNFSTKLDYQYSSNLNDIEVKLLTNISFGLLDSITIKLTDIVKPSDVDKSFLGNYSNGFDFKTNQFHCKLFSFRNKSIVSRTVSNLNQAFIGYNKRTYEEVQVFCQGQKNLIAIRPQVSVICQLSVSTSTLKAKKLQLIPISEMTFDQSFYTLTQNQPSSPFQIGAPYYMNPGTYYISWYLIEDPLVQNETLYGPMDVNQVQLYDIKVSININLKNTVINSQTAPAMLSLNNYFPFSNLYIVVSLEPDDGKFKLTGNQIALTPYRNFGYFSISVNQSKGRELTKSEVKVKFQMFGRYLSGFEIKNQIDFKPVYKKANLTLKASVKWIKESKRLVLQLSESATVFWAFGPRSSFIYHDISTIESIIAKTYPLQGFPQDNQLTLQQQSKIFTDYLTWINSSDWVEFQEIRKDFISTFLFFYQVFLNTGEHVLFETSSTIPTLEYSAIVWVEDRSGNQSQLIWSGQTDEFLNHCHLKIKSRGNLTNPTKAFSRAYKVPQERFLFLDYSTQNDLIFFYQFLFLSDFSSKVSPWAIFQNVTRIELQSYFKGAKILEVSCENITKNESGIPMFIDTISRVESETLVVNSYSDIRSFVCCIAEYEPDYNLSLSVSDIKHSRDRNMEQASFSECYQNLFENFTLHIPLGELVTPGEYLITCIMCNDYPMNPLCTDSNGSYTYELIVTDIGDSDFATLMELWWILALGI